MHGIDMHNPFDPGYYQSDDLRGFGFAQVGDNVRIAKNCTIIAPENIRIGDNVRIDAFTTLIAANGKMHFEGYNHIGGHCHFAATESLTFDPYSGSSQGVRIYTATDDLSGKSLTGPMAPAGRTAYKTAPVRIGRHAVLCSGSVVLPGCSLGEGAVLGALSLATRRLRAWSVYLGVPCRRVGERDKGMLALEDGVPLAIAA